MKIAKEKGLQELKHHILPRTKGFTLLLQGAEDRSKKKKWGFFKVIFTDETRRIILYLVIYFSYRNL